MSGVNRFKICTYELGDGPLTADEQSRIREALHAEAERLRHIMIHVDFGSSAAIDPRRAVSFKPRPTDGTGVPVRGQSPHLDGLTNPPPVRAIRCDVDALVPSE